MNMKTLLISTYELGRQPFGLASPAAWLRKIGSEVNCVDLSQEKLNEDLVRGADIVAIYLPMHTATRIALRVFQKIRILNPSAHLCAYGLYAPLNAEFLRKLGVNSILGGEFEESLLNIVKSKEQIRRTIIQDESIISLRKQKFVTPDRTDLPPLEKYAHLHMPDGTERLVGYTEATRGCKHLCRHCPIVPVYQGQFRVVQRDVVLEDIRHQVDRGAQHITFGDPDFFNGIRHSIELIREFHHEFPRLTYDVVIKIEHLLKYVEHLRTLKDTGCLFVTSAVESVDNRVLEIFQKRHTRADFIKVVELFRKLELVLIPTFVAFTPWITIEGYEDLLSTLIDLDLVDHVPPIQLAIRLLIPAGSKLLEMADVQKILGPFDEEALAFQWTHPDSRMDELQSKIEALVQATSATKQSRRSIFNQIGSLLWEFKGSAPKPSDKYVYSSRTTIPYLTEPWYC